MIQNDRRSTLAVRTYSYGKNNRASIASVLKTINLTRDVKFPIHAVKVLNAYFKFLLRRVNTGRQANIGVLGNVLVKGKTVNYSKIVPDPIFRQYTNEHTSGLKYKAYWFKSRWIKKRACLVFHGGNVKALRDEINSGRTYVKFKRKMHVEDN